MIQINNLTYSYRKSRKTVFSDFNLSFEAGRIYGLLGANGVGKSTLLYNILGVLTPQNGSVKVDGHESRKREVTMLRDCYIVPEEYELPSCSLAEYVAVYSPFYPKFSREQLSEYLTIFEMEENPNIGSLSMGQKKKVLMCFALACNTSLLILDDPTRGLDLPSKSQFRKLITSGMNDEKCIIISTHQVNDIENILDSVVILDYNRLLLNADISTISEKLVFGENGENPIYSQPSPGGFYTVCRNETGTGSAVRLELLFNAVLTQKEAITDLFK
jgi:ABC-2 type transport system ATP-binding protein